MLGTRKLNFLKVQVPHVGQNVFRKSRKIEKSGKNRKIFEFFKKVKEATFHHVSASANPKMTFFFDFLAILSQK